MPIAAPATVVATGLKADHQGCRRILGVIVIVMSEIRGDGAAQHHEIPVEIIAGDNLPKRFWCCSGHQDC